MPALVKVSGAWRNIAACYVKVSGVWRDVLNIFVKVSGAWKALWSYSWQIGTWGACSKSCGGGTQTRAVTCLRSDGVVSPDEFCLAGGAGAKPAASQPCNTQGCITCRFSSGNYDWYYWSADNSVAPNYMLWTSVFWGGMSPVYYGYNNATSINYGGYRYTRGAFKFSSQGQYPSQGVENIYEVCRQPV